MQPYPRSPDLAWPGHLHGTGCLSARAVGTGFPTVVRRLCLGPVCGWVWVLLTQPVLAGVLGGCVWARFVVLSFFCRLFVVFVVELRFRPAYGACVVSCALRLPPAVSGSGVRCGCACWARVPAVPRPSWLGCWGVFFALLIIGFCRVGCWVSLSWALWFLSPHPLSFRLGCWLFFFFFHGVCLHVSVPLFPVGRCSWLGVAGFGCMVPLCFFGGPVFGAFLVGGLAASGGVGGRFGGCGLFSRPPLPPPFGGGGGGCLFLPLPSLGWHTHWPAFSVVFRAAVGGCVLFGRVPAPWVGWAMYTLGSAPLLAGLVLALLAGRLRQAAACGSGLGGWGCSCPFPSAVPVLTFWVVRHRCCRARSGPVRGLWCRCVACWCGAFRGVRHVACCGQSFRLGSVVPCCAALCRVASRRAVARCTVACCGAMCRGLALCRGGSVEVSLACVVLRSAGRSVAGWWLGGAVRCGCLAGSVLWGPRRAARAGGSGRRPWGCPPWGPVPWSRVLWGFRSLALVAVAVPSFSSGVCEVALVATGVVSWG